MPKIDLSHNQRLQAQHGQLVRPMANRQSDMVFYISKKHARAVYYVHEYNKETHVVTWTRHRRNAVCFRTQQAVYQYLHAYLNNRSDVYLVHALQEM